MKDSDRDYLNSLFAPLEFKSSCILSRFVAGAIPAVARWYSGHYSKDDSGEYREDLFPIPVISVKGLCDLEIGFDQISVSAKKRRKDALAYDFGRIPVPFQVYGVKNYLADYYLPGMTPEQLRENLKNSGEAEIGVSFPFPFETEPETLFRFAELLKREGFYDNRNT